MEWSSHSARESQSLEADAAHSAGGGAGSLFGCCGAGALSPNASPVASPRCSLGGSSPSQQGSEPFLLLHSFCEEVPPARVAPTGAELEELWLRCASFRPAGVSKALSLQLSRLLEPGEDAYAWQAHSRALQALIHFYGKGKAGKTIGDATMEQSHELVRHLATDMPECADLAARALEVWQLSVVTPDGCEAQMLDAGGLMRFTQEASAERRGDEDAPPDERASGAPARRPSGAVLVELARATVEEATPARAAERPAPEEDLLDLSANCCSPQHAEARAHPEAQLLLELGPLASELGRALQAPTPQVYAMCEVDSLPSDNADLSEMFSFARKEPIVFPILTDKYLAENMPKPKDPFDFVADHLWQK